MAGESALRADGRECLAVVLLAAAAATSGLVVPLLPFGMPKYDAGERFDLRSPYSDDGWVVSKSTGLLVWVQSGA